MVDRLSDPRRQERNSKVDMQGDSERPSFNELFYPNFGNPNLGPEQSNEWDAGLSKA